MSTKSDLHYEKENNDSNQIRVYFEHHDDTWHIILGGGGVFADVIIGRGTPLWDILRFADLNPNIVKSWVNKNKFRW